MSKSEIAALRNLSSRAYVVKTLISYILSKPADGFVKACFAAEVMLGEHTDKPGYKEILGAYEDWVAACYLYAKNEPSQRVYVICIRHGFYHEFMKCAVVKRVNAVRTATGQRPNVVYEAELQYNKYKKFDTYYGAIYHCLSIADMLTRWRNISNNADDTGKIVMRKLILEVFLIVQLTGGYFPNLPNDDGTNLRILGTFLNENGIS